MIPGASAPRPEPAAAGSVGGPGPTELFAALPVAVLVVGPDGRIAQVNAAGEALLNLSQRAMAGQPLTGVIRTAPTQAIEGRGVAAYDIDIGTERTGHLHVDYSEVGLPDRPGWRVVTLHPVGQARRGPAQRAAARAATGAAAMLAHEIKNPLSGIRGAAQLLAGSGGSASDAELTTLITTEVDRIAALIDRMQGFTDGRPLSLAAANIYPLIAHVRRVAQAGFSRAIAIEERFDPSLPPALVDGGALTQVLLNLMKNAAEALGGQPDGRITLATAYRHGFAVDAGLDQPRRRLPIELAVIDNGPGAPADIADHLFDPFVSSKPEGQGLGLAMVDKLTHDMGGVVHYAREGTPEVTVFRLFLPRGA